MGPTDVQDVLSANGFPCGKIDGDIGPQTRAAVTRFQQAYNGAPWLKVDGVPGPLTQAALVALPHLSAHFAVAELACHHCGLAYVRRELLAGLEGLRAYLLGPIPLLDAYRCPTHNAAVGGAADSMHLYGLGADPDFDASVADVAGRRLFSGIGDKNGVVQHVDRRHLSAHNLTPNATVDKPARWHY